MIPEGSAQWQQDIFLAASLFLLWEIWSGWRLGAVRGLLRLAALFCAWIGGSAAAGATGTCLAFFSKVPPLLAPAVAGLTIGIGIYIGISFLAGLLFKKTEHHAGLVRFGFGLGGAACGLIFGILFLWTGITLIRGMGALGELRIVQARNEGHSPATEQKALFLIKLKASLELGTVGQWLKQVDPLPSAVYDDIVKISQVGGDQRAFERFIQYPKTLELLKNPNVTAFLEDPALEKASQSRNILPLLQNKHLQAVLQDQQLLVQLRAFDLTGALDYALEPSIQVQSRKTRRPFSPNSPSATAHAIKNPLRTSPTPGAAH